MATIAACNAMQRNYVCKAASCAFSKSVYKANCVSHNRMTRVKHTSWPTRQLTGAAIRGRLHIVAARTESTDIPLGNIVPEFEVSRIQDTGLSQPAKLTPRSVLQLKEPLTGATVSLQQAKGKNGTLLVFMCNHCPFVIHLRGRNNMNADSAVRRQCCLYMY